MVFFLFWVNTCLLNKNAKLGEIITVSIFGTKKSSEIVVDALEISPIQRSIWICIAAIVAGMALTLGGCVIQSVTQNPLADSSTLGFINSTIFGIILMKGMFSDDISGSNYHIFYLVFAFIGGLITLIFLSFLFKNPRHQGQHLKIILMGLVLNMMFKTFTHIVKTYNPNAVNSSFALTMGGAENIYGLYTNQFSILKWCGIVVVILLGVCVLLSQKLNLFELGEEQAKTLGVNVKVMKHFCYLIILITTTIAILLVGNVAFIGLICTHSIRQLFKTRKYQMITPLGSLMGVIIMMIGITINALIPFISSSIFVLFLGGCVLLSITLNNKSNL